MSVRLCTAVKGCDHNMRQVHRELGPICAMHLQRYFRTGKLGGPASQTIGKSTSDGARWNTRHVAARLARFHEKAGRFGFEIERAHGFCRARANSKFIGRIGTKLLTSWVRRGWVKISEDGSSTEKVFLTDAGKKAVA